jgi:hypothetical protein
MTKNIEQQRCRSRWLDWKPRGVISAVTPNTGPTKPSELISEHGSVGFIGSNQDIPEKPSCPTVNNNGPPETNSPSLETKPTTNDQVNVSPQSDEHMPAWRRRLSSHLKKIKKQ